MELEQHYKTKTISGRTYFETNTEREGKGGHHHGPGYRCQDPATDTNTVVRVIS